MQKNYDSLDMLKFILSLTILAIHSGLFGGAIYPYARLAVPLFFIISGFFAFGKLDNISDSQRRWSALWNMLLRYLKLYGFWFVVLSPVTFLFRGYFRDGLVSGLVKLLEGFLFTSTFQGSWYLMACIQGILVVYLLSRKFGNKTILALSIPFYIYATLVSKHESLISTVPVLKKWVDILHGPFPTPYGSVILSTIYITLGKMTADGDFRNIKKRTSLFLAAAFCGLLLVEYGLHTRHEWFVRSADCWLMLAPAALFVFLIVLNLDLQIPQASLLRKLSTLLYCQHMAVIYIFDILFYKLGIPNSMGVTLFLCTLITTVVSSLIILKLKDKKAFGFLRYAF